MPITRKNFIKTGLLIGTGVALTDALWVENFFIEIKEFFWEGANKNTENIKIVQISDLHLRSINYQLKQLAKKINGLKPDLILITGDAIDKAENIYLLGEYLAMIDKNIKKAAILGNWEYWGHVNLTKLKDIYASNNCSLLVNATRQYSFKNKTISITGVDDFIGGNADIKAALKEYIKSDYHVILNHCPQYSDSISTQLSEECYADFILSGHTHGGQINILGFVPFLPKGSGRYVKGWYDKNTPKLYVSRGIGTSISPVRFGSRAEIAIFNLKT